MMSMVNHGSPFQLLYPLVMALAQESLALQRARVQATWSQGHKCIRLWHFEGYGTVNATNDIQMSQFSKDQWGGLVLLYLSFMVCVCQISWFAVDVDMGPFPTSVCFPYRTHFPAPCSLDLISPWFAKFEHHRHRHVLPVISHVFPLFAWT